MHFVCLYNLSFSVIFLAAINFFSKYFVIEYFELTFCLFVWVCACVFLFICLFILFAIFSSRLDLDVYYYIS